MPRRKGAWLLLLVAGAIVIAIALGLGSTRGPAEGFQDALVHVVKSVSPSVVQIETSTGLGSGIVFDDKGNVVTNAHVVGSAQRRSG
jgi:putative serine protease PepD